MSDILIPITTVQDSSTGGGWQKPRSRNRRSTVSVKNVRFSPGGGWHARGFSRGSLRSRSAGECDVDAASDTESEFSLVDEVEEYEDDGLSYCDDRESIEEWDFVDATAVSRLIDKSLSYASAAVRGYKGSNFKHGARDALEAKRESEWKLRKQQMKDRKSKRLERRLALLNDLDAVLSSDEEVTKAVHVEKTYQARVRRSKSALYCRSKSLSKKKDFKLG